jgi:hypothetical protein
VVEVIAASPSRRIRTKRWLEPLSTSSRTIELTTCVPSCKKPVSERCSRPHLRVGLAQQRQRKIRALQTIARQQWPSAVCAVPFFGKSTTQGSSLIPVEGIGGQGGASMDGSGQIRIDGGCSARSPMGESREIFIGAPPARSVRVSQAMGGVRKPTPSARRRAQGGIPFSRASMEDSREKRTIASRQQVLKTHATIRTIPASARWSPSTWPHLSGA